jgi:hypothetical protein
MNQKSLQLNLSLSILEAEITEYSHGLIQSKIQLVAMVS